MLPSENMPLKKNFSKINYRVKVLNLLCKISIFESLDTNTQRTANMLSGKKFSKHDELSHACFWRFLRLFAFVLI